MGLSIQMAQKLTLSLPYTNWSLVTAYNEEGSRPPLQFKKKKLEGIDNLPLEQRLQKIDNENEVFRFVYAQVASDDGKKGRYYKVPLMRDFNVDIKKIKIPISKREYERATIILEGAGRMQRIVRAVPYSKLRKDIREHLQKQGKEVDDAVIIGVDRGGRVPTHIVKEALGKQRAYFLKVDQGGGSVNESRIAELIQNNLLEGKYILFVDSTVDSGRQISALKRYFEDPKWKEKAGFVGWSVIGSNERGETLDHHVNVNWGLNPDESFEDNPLLMGVDYAQSNIQIRAMPSRTSTEIRRILREIPKGIVFDLENLDDRITREKMYSNINHVCASREWFNAVQTPNSRKRKPTKIDIFPERKPFEEHRLKLAVIGAGKEADLTNAEAKYLALSLSPYFVFQAGTPEGNPGKLLEAVYEHCRDSNVTLVQPAYIKKKENTFLERPIVYKGKTKEQFREGLLEDADAVLVLGGNSGALTETMIALATKTPIIAVKNYGAVGRYLAQSRKLKKSTNLYLTDSVIEATESLVKLSQK